jgi:hypothetical protein
VTLQLLHLEYLERHPDGYRYTKFCGVYQQLRGLLEAQPEDRGARQRFACRCGP